MTGLKWNSLVWINICFQMPKCDSAQNVKICHLRNSRSKLEEHFVLLYTHTHIAYLKHFLLFIPKQDENGMPRYWKTEMQRMTFCGSFSWVMLIRHEFSFLQKQGWGNEKYITSAVQSLKYITLFPSQSPSGLKGTCLHSKPPSE